MPRHEESVVIRRPLREVFDYMNDVSREREWQKQLREAEQIPPGPVAVGTRRRYASEFLGRRLENTYVITTYEPGRRVVAETTEGSVLSATSDIRWEEIEDGTRVTMTLDGRASGPLRFVPGPLVEATFTKEIRNALRLLKERLEMEG